MLYSVCCNHFKMANLVHMLILLVCVLHVDSRDTRRSNGKQMMTHKRSISDYAGVREYNNCYSNFMRLYVDNSETYHSVCRARQKLNVCKDIVEKAYPSVGKHIKKGYEHECETTADFWCTFNMTHHGPAKPFLNIDIMYQKHQQCPYVHDLMLTPGNYLPDINLVRHRAEFASAILTYTGADGLSKWQLNHKYSDPHDPVHKALSAVWCDVYKNEAYITGKLMTRYCVIVKDIHSELKEVVDTYERHSIMGLYNWTASLCTKYEEPLEHVMRLAQLAKWLSSKKKPDLSPCHEHNIYIEGATCLIMFHTRLPPYSRMHNFMAPFVMNIPELNSCWDRVTSACRPSSASRNISLLVEIYNLASEISKGDLGQVWDVIWSWSELYKRTERAQWKLQRFYQLLSPEASSPSSFPVAFGSSLARALPSVPPKIAYQFTKLSSALDKISVVGNDDYTGLNIFEGFHSMNKDVLDVLLISLRPLYELFAEVSEFVQYTAHCPEWWPQPCE